MESAAHRWRLFVLAAAIYIAVTIALSIVETPGLGVGHFFYIAVALTAIAGGPWIGIAGGVLAAVLFNVGIAINPSLPAAPVWIEVGIRMVTFSAVGVVVGLYAVRNRKLVGELSGLAERDQLTGLPNTRAFETAIEKRLDRGRPFALVVGDIDELRRTNDDGRDAGDDLLRRLAEKLVITQRNGEEVARIGEDEFAVLADLTRSDARRLALLLEQQLAGPAGSITFGWAAFPQDGENALALYRVADERLYARKVARGYRRSFAPA